MALLLTQEDLKPLVHDAESLRQLLNAIEASVLAQARGEGGQATFLAFPLQDGPRMDVYTTTSAQAATVRIFPAGHLQPSPDRNLMLLMDPASGQLLALLAGDDLNALRTAVPAALGAIKLAPRGASSLCILGSGEQAVGHITTLCAGMEAISDIRIYSRTPANRERFAKDWGARLGRNVRAVSSAEEAIRGADIVCVAADVGKSALKGEWFKPGAVVTNVVSMGLEDVLARLVVPSMKRPQTVFPRWMKPSEPMNPNPPRPAADLASVLRGEASARERDSDIVHYSIAAPYGWDAPVMRWAYEWAVKNRVGTEMRLSAR